MKNKKAISIGYILEWLVIFIVGSLIVSFLIYPESFTSFKENIKETSSKVVTPTVTPIEDSSIKTDKTNNSKQFNFNINKIFNFNSGISFKYKMQ